MSDFDDFKQDRDQKKSDAEKLASDAVLEWSYLKDRAGDFARDGKDVDGHRFEWFAEPNNERLVLNYSAATFLGPGWQKPAKFGVYIDRRPPGPGQMYVDDSRPVPSRRWNLEPSVERGEFSWKVRETGWKGSTAALVSEIAKAVVTHYDEYKKRFPQAV